VVRVVETPRTPVTVWRGSAPVIGGRAAARQWGTRGRARMGAGACMCAREQIGASWSADDPGPLPFRPERFCDIESQTLATRRQSSIHVTWRWTRLALLLVHCARPRRSPLPAVAGPAAAVDDRPAWPGDVQLGGGGGVAALVGWRCDGG
jgi:hypothetical protein